MGNKSASAISQRLPDTGLANWRLRPHSQWAFQNVRELMPTAEISAARSTNDSKKMILETQFSDWPESQGWGSDPSQSLNSLLLESEADNMAISHRGKKVWEWSAPHFSPDKPHIIFSISKSITAMLAGILVEQGVINVTKPISHYLPLTRGSAYEDCLLQHVLDMSVALDFKEDYLNPDGDYKRYRDATGWNPVDQTQPGLSTEDFLSSLKKANFEHGEVFGYRSPNSDLLGLLLERAAGVPFAELLSQLLWKPLGADSDGYVTVDRSMLARAAGGICVTSNDLLRFGQMMLNQGHVNSQPLVPQSWIDDTLQNGDQQAWQKGDFTSFLPDGCYRNQWYQIGNTDKCFAAIGIHGQWLYVNPTTEVVIVKMSSQAEPVDEALDIRWLTVFEQLTRAVQ